LAHACFGLEQIGGERIDRSAEGTARPSQEQRDELQHMKGKRDILALTAKRNNVDRPMVCIVEYFALIICDKVLEGINYCKAF